MEMFKATSEMERGEQFVRINCTQCETFFVLLGSKQECPDKSSGKINSKVYVHEAQYKHDIRLHNSSRF